MVQYSSARLDASFAALSDATRQLWDSRFDELDRIVEELKRKE